MHLFVSIKGTVKMYRNQPFHWSLISVKMLLLNEALASLGIMSDEFDIHLQRESFSAHS